MILFCYFASCLASRSNRNMGFHPMDFSFLWGGGCLNAAGRNPWRILIISDLFDNRKSAMVQCFHGLLAVPVFWGCMRWWYPLRLSLVFSPNPQSHQMPWSFLASLGVLHPTLCAYSKTRGDVEGWWKMLIPSYGGCLRTYGSSLAEVFFWPHKFPTLSVHFHPICFVGLLQKTQH